MNPPVIIDNQGNNLLSNAIKEYSKDSKEIKIATGYFRISGFNLMKNDLKNLRQPNQGDAPFKIIMGDETGLETAKEMNNGYNLKKKISNSIKKDIKEEEGGKLSNLAELIVEGYLDIKIYTEGKFHPKCYLFLKEVDSDLVEGNLIIGSSNFTYPGLEKNLELNYNDKGCLGTPKFNQWFNDIWESKTERFNLFLLKIIENNKNYQDYAGGNKRKKLKGKIDQLEKEEKGITLFKYQKKAIKNWIDSGKKGIFSMATGTGKTYTSLGAVKQLIDSGEKLGIIIVTPQNTLTSQWIKDNLVDFDLHGDEVYGSSKKSLDLIANNVLDLDAGDIDYFILGTTYDSFYSAGFLKEVSKSESKLMIIADESHNITEKRFAGLSEKYDYRLALSATPERYFDDEGTKKIREYFYGKKNFPEKDTYEFSLSDAITKINPLTGKTYLVPYNYYMFYCPLTEEEYEKYNRFSISIRIAFEEAKKTKDYSDYKIRLRQRKDIIKGARNKISTCDEIIRKIKKMDHGLFFLDNGKQIDKLTKMIEVNYPEKFTYKIFTSEKFKNPASKQKFLNQFKEGKFQALLAIDCFSEGLDVPCVEDAIFVASSTNPKEFVQRRGRVLRHYGNKKNANIYDVLVTSPEKNGSGVLFESEMKRAKVFIKDALNKRECEMRLKKESEEI
jgi:superfamily II DNA or RNA helicase